MTDLWTFRDDVGADRADLDGLTVEAVDGSVGSVQDVISDIDGAYLLIDTGPPILGKTVFLPGRPRDGDRRRQRVAEGRPHQGRDQGRAGLRRGPGQGPGLPRRDRPHYGAT
jgi:hypothetical protein